ncbi:MAG: thermonuclease family protein [Pseudomonadota bacterium]
MTPQIWLILACLCVLAAVWLLWSPSTLKTPQERSGRVSYVIDGDTLILARTRLKIRLWGVDAPEMDQAGGEASASYLRQIAEGQAIRCQEITIDRYGRSVSRCFLSDGREINRMMIDSPHAKEYRRFTKGFYGR